MFTGIPRTASKLRYRASEESPIGSHCSQELVRTPYAQRRLKRERMILPLNHLARQFICVEELHRTIRFDAGFMLLFSV